ncbi:hypothetical protein SCLCIDRAFT_1216569 [Scleroderma citrinum Foug A]|uniref:Uncharacterized protein n=1 Tax=Scleroderma citrinum Foug A TaxID=1036808 RepID=A0A0C2ZG74_9AGAM|nr:hypothetical protein SCLCIDRAFT_1216569 [Scleroderma citrinum Foug A]
MTSCKYNNIPPSDCKMYEMPPEEPSNAQKRLRRPTQRCPQLPIKQQQMASSSSTSGASGTVKLP